MCNQHSEFSAVVWDIEYQSSVVGGILPESMDDTQNAQKFSFGEAVASLTWLNSPHLLATGTSKGWIRLCDIRMGKTNDVMSIRISDGDKLCKVKGIKVDPFNPSTMATYSDLPGESVKIIDVRKGGSSSSASSASSSSSVQVVQDTLGVHSCQVVSPDAW